MFPPMGPELGGLSSMNQLLMSGNATLAHMHSVLGDLNRRVVVLILRDGQEVELPADEAARRLRMDDVVAVRLPSTSRSHSTSDFFPFVCFVLGGLPMLGLGIWMIVDAAKLLKRDAFFAVFAGLLIVGGLGAFAAGVHFLMSELQDRKGVTIRLDRNPI